MHTVTIVGLGLIGGSAARDLRRENVATSIIGVDQNPAHAGAALALGLVDEVLPLQEAVEKADVVLLAVPVNAIGALLRPVLDLLPEHATLIDFGSTKSALCGQVRQHPKRGQYVAAHPIAGTENSGPAAALEHLYKGKTNIVCEREASSGEALATAMALFEALGLQTVFMDAETHDKQLAYISHLSHVSSFVLSMTVLDAEKAEKDIFALAGSGFASTVRLAKSSPAMWAPIFEQNSAYLGQAIEEYITILKQFQEHLQSGNTAILYQMMEQANKIRPVLEGKAKTPAL
ncbi:prephenate dehydrogenase [Pontibacter mangrovi]|uniref:Prephenate dehydrogenase n=1 Tax=Pontibacter mangrovi TaxID=2589816 RepID=A0A501WBN9_9BACT|nr:prephenate dehydrogenase [Pontibacter mangrovi]TPE44227.1 prephenate dehydrogenase [Pontibacter mangrovi]